MTFLVDTNIFVHAVNTSSPSYEKARRFLDQHRRLRTPWCVTWPIIYEFLRVATHGRVFPKPLKAEQAIAFMESLIAADEVAILAPTDRHVPILQTIVSELSHPAGNLFHDVHTAAVMREHGVREIVTADTDFLQFEHLKVLNPLR